MSVLAVLLAACGRSGPSATPTTTQAQSTQPQTTQPQPTTPRPVPPEQDRPTERPPYPPPPGRTAFVVIGDSLSVGTAPLLPAIMPGWQVRTDGQGGRPLAVGMQILANTPLPPDGSAVLGFSLFTNDDPTHMPELEQAVQTSLQRAGPRGCVVWATIARPPVNGASYDAANETLRRLATADGRLRLVDWARLIAREPALMGPDGIHPTPQGYGVRAEMFAEAARSCGPPPPA